MKTEKSLFCFLVSVTILFLVLIASIVWYLMQDGLAKIHSFLPIIFAFLLMLLVAFFLSAFFCIVLMTKGVKLFSYLEKLSWRVILFLYPLFLFVAKITGVKKEACERAFIDFSNKYMKNKKIKVTPDKLLILLPQCLQWDECSYKVTKNIENCKQCGKCQVADFLKISRRYGVKVALVTGGTLARKVIKEKKPKLVLAVACERDLVSGIQDVFPIQVIGILNKRPFGPCLNTRVDLKEVEMVLQEVLVYKA